jgi:hypothetical protein
VAWLNPENLKWLVATLAVPAALGYVSYQYERAQTQRQLNDTRAQNQRQIEDARLRLYTELLSTREQADTSVRKGIFDKVLDTYLKPGSQDLEAKIVALELLTVNFNDSLDLSPLFWELDRELQRLPKQRRTALEEQLERIAWNVKARQIETLQLSGKLAEVPVDLEQLPTQGPIINEDFSFDDPDPFAPKGRKLTRHFQVEILEHQPALRRVLARVQERVRNEEEKQWVFWVDAFDFPLVNFTKVSKAERFTLQLTQYHRGRSSAQVALIYFPSARSGIKDKPFIDEVISDLLREPTLP